MALITSRLLDGAEEVKIRIRYAGSNPVLAGYEYQLKTYDTNEVLEERSGDNQEGDDDIFILPMPVAENTGRKVVLSSAVAAIDKDSDFEITMEVIQDGEVTDTLINTGHVPADGDSKHCFDIIKFI